MKQRGGAKVVFVTGTDTGAGKTILTALLLAHLRARGCHALAAKPFTTGGRGDARLLHSLQDRTLTLEEVNPHSFKMPAAPLVAARAERRQVTRREVLRQLLELKARAEVLFIEGAGGLLTPLGNCYTALNLIVDLKAAALLAAPNRLGVLSQSATAVSCLQTGGVKKKSVILTPVSPRKSDGTTRTNRAVLAEILGNTPVFEMPRLAMRGRKTEYLKETAKKNTKLLAKIWESL